MNILFSKKLNTFLILTFLLIGCSDQDKKQEFAKYMKDETLLVEKLLENVPKPVNDFLVFPKDLCRKCFHQIINHFENQKEKGKVILLGANSFDIKRLNRIYKHSLRFWKGEFEYYNELLAAYPRFVLSYVRYVKIETDTLIYEGQGKNLTEKINDVLSQYLIADKNSD